MKVKRPSDSPAATLGKKLVTESKRELIRAPPFFTLTAGMYGQDSKQTWCLCQERLKSLVPLPDHQWDFSGWRWMPLKEKEVGSSRVKGGREVSFTQARHGDQAPELPQGHTWDPCRGRACHVGVFDFITAGTIAKPLGALQDPQKAVASGLISSRIYGESRINGPRAHRKAIKSPLLTTEHSGWHASTM